MDLRRDDGKGTRPHCVTSRWKGMRHGTQHTTRVRGPCSRVLVHTGWWRGVVASVVRRMNKVTLRRPRLVLGWVTVFGRVYYHRT